MKIYYCPHDKRDWLMQHDLNGHFTASQGFRPNRSRDRYHACTHCMRAAMDGKSVTWRRR